MIMNTEYHRDIQKLYETKAILAGLEDIKAGRTINGEDALRRLREKYLERDPDEILRELNI